jgi:photosystem II stability/assembly factor-like uncharacterized protein
MKRFVQPLALALMASAVLADVEAPGEVDRSMPARLAPESLLLDGGRLDGRLVAVGERGHVLVSDDGGASWRQVVVPAAVLLTAVSFPDGRHGWAVGHDGVVIATGDAGESWTLQNFAPDQERPLLDVLFHDADHGLAIGAYGYYLRTDDGGETWTEELFEPEPLPDEADEEDEWGLGDVLSDLHLNALDARGERVYIAAEAGHLFRSDDRGETWRELPSPYEGSFFGVLVLDDPDDVLVLGLRGHLFRSEDGGETWAELALDIDAQLTDARRLADGRVLITGRSGLVLLSDDGGRSFRVVPTETRTAYATAIQAEDGAVWLLGEPGLRRLALARIAE